MRAASTRIVRTFNAATPTGPIHCRLDGPDSAPCIVLSNSHATQLSMWDGQIAALTERHRVLRYDQRGHGSTPPTPPPYSFDELSEDVLTVMDAAGVAQASLIGISMGAVTMLRAAARWPQRIRAVIGCDGQWRSPPQARKLWAERIEQVQRSGTASLAKATVARWFRSGFAERSPEAAAAVERMIAGTSLAGYVGCAQAMQAYDFSADYPALAMPVMYLVGGQDGALPAAMQAMAAATRDATYVEIDDAGHLPNIEQPVAFNRAILRFLDAVHEGLSR